MTSSPDISSLSVGRCRKGARDECVLATAARRSALGPVSESATVARRSALGPVSESCEDCRCMSCVVEPDGSRDPLRSDGGLIAASSGMRKGVRTIFFWPWARRAQLRVERQWTAGTRSLSGNGAEPLFSIKRARRRDSSLLGLSPNARATMTPQSVGIPSTRSWGASQHRRNTRPLQRSYARNGVSASHIRANRFSSARSIRCSPVSRNPLRVDQHPGAGERPDLMLA
jgi:hypothetical protein